jgi:hypothetical protein
MAPVGAAASLLVWDSVVKLVARGNMNNPPQEEKHAEKRIREALASADDGEGIRLLLTAACASEGVGMTLDLIEEALRARACALVDGEGGQQVVLVENAAEHEAEREVPVLSNEGDGESDDELVEQPPRSKRRNWKWVQRNPFEHRLNEKQKRGLARHFCEHWEKRRLDLDEPARVGSSVFFALGGGGKEKRYGTLVVLGAARSKVRYRTVSRVDVEVEVDTAAFWKRVPRLQTKTIEGWVTELGVIGGVALVRLEYRVWNVKRRRAAICRFDGILLLLLLLRERFLSPPFGTRTYRDPNYYSQLPIGNGSAVSSRSSLRRCPLHPLSSQNFAREQVPLASSSSGTGSLCLITLSPLSHRSSRDGAATPRKNT